MAEDRFSSTMMFRIDRRDQILHRVRLGEMKPAEAERKVKWLGLAPFESRPGPDEFDPRSKSRWSLPMTLAWIVWRDLEEVRQYDNKYRERCLVWRPFDVSTEDGSTGAPAHGFVIAPLDPTSGQEFEAFGYLPADRDEGRMRPPDTPRLAKADLWGKMQDDELTAEGIPAQGLPRVRIPAHEWVDLVDGRGRDPGDEFFRYRRDWSRRVYRDVVWRRIDVLRLWPEHHGETEVVAKAPAANRRAPSPADSPAFLSWVQGRISENEPPPTRQDVEAWARERGLSAEWARVEHSALSPSLKLGIGETLHTWRKRHPSSEM